MRCLLLRPLLLRILVVFSLLWTDSLLSGEQQGLFEIGDIRFRVYDNSEDRYLDAPLNAYGLGMDLSIAVQLRQLSEATGNYRIQVSGHGEGRENEAEGLVEDYSVTAERMRTLYAAGERYVPFIVDYPCTELADFTITVRKDTGQEARKEVRSPFSYCSMN